MAFPGEVLSSGMGLSKGVVGSVAGIGVVISSALKGFKRIPEGEKGVRTGFGKVKFDKNGEPKVVGSGLHGVPPFTHSIETISILDRPHDLESFAIEKGGEKYNVKSSITWAVSPEKEHVYRALFRTTALTETVTNICATGLRFVMNSLEQDNFYDNHAVAEGVSDVCDEDLLIYGVLLKRLQLREVARSEAQVLAGALRGNSSANDIGGHLVAVAGA